MSLYPSEIIIPESYQDEEYVVLDDDAEEIDVETIEVTSGIEGIYMEGKM